MEVPALCIMQTSIMRTNSLTNQDQENPFCVVGLFYQTLRKGVSYTCIMEYLELISYSTPKNSFDTYLENCIIIKSCTSKSHSLYLFDK